MRGEALTGDRIATQQEFLHRIVPQSIGIIRVGIAAGQAKDPLRYQICERVPYLAGLSILHQTPREAVDELVLALSRLQQHGAAVGTRMRLIEGGNEGAIEEVRQENSLWSRLVVQRRRLRVVKGACRNDFLPCGGVCVSTEIGPFVNFAG